REQKSCSGRLLIFMENPYNCLWCSFVGKNVLPRAQSQGPKRKTRCGMSQTLLVIRIFFFTLVVLGSYLLAYAVPEWDDSRWVVVLVGALLGALVILVDLLLKGFSLRGLSAITFGLFIGWVIATFISNSP